MSDTVVASDGTELPLDALSVMIGYTSGQVTTLTVQYYSQATQGLRNFVQTITYSVPGGSGVATGVSGWAAQ